MKSSTISDQIKVFSRRSTVFRGIKLISLVLFLYALWSIYHDVHDEQLSLKFDNWQNCKKLIWQGSKYSSWFGKLFFKKKVNNQRTDDEVWTSYGTQDCNDILAKKFSHPLATETELEFPIAYGILVHKGAPLLEQLLQAIYMPHNAYCLHIDVKASETFKRAVESMTRCLDNVFITKNSVDVVWAHISILQAQLNCVADLLQSPVKWKYFVSLVGQDFPLYDNNGIVNGLKTLQGKNNIDSYPMPEGNKDRTLFVFHFEKTSSGQFSYGDVIKTQTSIRKEPPPHSLKIYKGSNHVALTRRFAEFILFDQKAKDFYNWLNDTFIPDETFYATLQQVPGVPGGHQGNQTWIMRSMKWWSDQTCWGYILRDICWMDVADLRWALSKEESKRLFVQKIPFDYNENMLKCLRIAAKGRNYGQGLFPKNP